MAKGKSKSFAGLVTPIASKTTDQPDEGKDGVQLVDKPDAFVPITDKIQLAQGEQNSYEAVIFTDAQRAKREDYTRRVKAGLETFVDVAIALIGLQEEKLYRETHSTFEEYCDEVFGLGRRRAYQLMEAGQTVLALMDSNGEAPKVLPTTTSHASALAEVEPSKQREVWDKVVQETSQTGERITAKKIAETNERLTGKSSSPKGGKKSKKENVDSDNNTDEFSDHQASITAEVLRNTENRNRQELEGNKATDEFTQQENETNLVTDELSKKQTDDNPSNTTTDEDEFEEDEIKDSDYDLSTNEVVQESRANTIADVRAAIRLAEGEEIQLVISGAFLIKNKLTLAWAILRGLDSPDSIDGNYSDMVSIEMAKKMGIV